MYQFIIVFHIKWILRPVVYHCQPLVLSNISDRSVPYSQKCYTQVQPLEVLITTSDNIEVFITSVKSFTTTLEPCVSSFAGGIRCRG